MEEKMGKELDSFMYTSSPKKQKMNLLFVIREQFCIIFHSHLTPKHLQTDHFVEK